VFLIKIWKKSDDNSYIYCFGSNKYLLPVEEYFKLFTTILHFFRFSDF